MAGQSDATDLGKARPQRQIPSVDELLARPRLAQLARQVSRGLVVDAVRSVLAELRTRLSAAHDSAAEAADRAWLEEQVIAQAERDLAPSLRSVINATGVILHTNLGRAPLSVEAIRQIAEAAASYSNLEYNLAEGARGKRDVHLAGLLGRLLGAEAAIVVNNNAAAVFLVLHSLARGCEVVVSRGELIEIGDGFRIPDIMAESGVVLREVGTTNRTRIADFERAISDRTRLLLRVHPSNFHIVGFTERPSLDQMLELGRRHSLPVYEDLGSGCLADLAPHGIQEPLARESVAAGVPVISFSGDKLLGGPQAGIIAGQRELVERLRRNPLFRALRVDKLTIAALETTLRAYLRGGLEEIPALRMIRMPVEEIAARAAALIERVQSELPAGEAQLELRDGTSVVGGGSTPDQSLPTRLLAVHSRRHSAVELEARLRLPSAASPVIARIEDDRLVLDLRTVSPEQEPALAAVLTAVLR